MKELKVVLIGAGNRGERYTSIMAGMKGKYKVVAVAEPIESRRNQIRQMHNIPDDRCFASWKLMMELGKIADLAIVATMDREHYEPAMKAISLNYHVLLEKPASPEPEECKMLMEYAHEMGVQVVVCHVLRYAPFFATIKSIVDTGALGDIISINHEECVGNIHQSHSYVRGNWGNEGRSANMLLAKSCHDIDILQWLLGKQCKKVQSFGALTHFKRENAPEGSPEYCIEGCPKGDICPYNAVKLYLDDKKNRWFRTTCTKQADPTDEMVEHALRTTQYGKCVYKCDNDVVDHQVVNMLFEDDVTVSFTMNAFNKGGRNIHIMGTKGELRGAMKEGSAITVYDFETKSTAEYPVSLSDSINKGHGGGDNGIVETLYEFLNGQYQGCAISDIGVSVKNHLVTFAAEESRKTGKVIDVEEYIKNIGHISQRG